jgi:hypothetical protein
VLCLWFEDGVNYPKQITSLSSARSKKRPNEKEPKK